MQEAGEEPLRTALDLQLPQLVMAGEVRQVWQVTEQGEQFAVVELG